MNIEATGTTKQQWTFRLFIRRNNNPNPRPVFTGQWIRFVKEKGLRAGDMIVFSGQQAEGDGVQDCPLKGSKMASVIKAAAAGGCREEVDRSNEGHGRK
ncbi:hypothetical protein SADUNF_Sadunf01G0177000 [Salix dunnii]|uniref:TF-B3 domain-containing protein n=1 Tax=Salix dunnii TaxID=1413687 RepID=A0A835NCZ3_9ROSI|nr:hypothetical protein SADUNF_Sadunf01G0177000 [Salix dunnii]